MIDGESSKAELLQKVFIWKYTILPKVLAPLLMTGLTTLVISMSTNLNVSACNDILGNLML